MTFTESIDIKSISSFESHVEVVWKHSAMAVQDAQK